MAESLAQRLQRIAAEKKAAREAAVAESEPAPEVVSNEPVNTVDLVVADSVVDIIADEASGIQSPESSSDGQMGEVSCVLADPVVDVSSSTELATSSSGTSSDHPLAMEFAELESMLLTRDPEFKVILRKVHKHLGQDAELVTQMTEEEIAMIVTGLVLFANTEIVEPAKVKTAKAAVRAASKQAISADDL